MLRDRERDRRSAATVRDDATGDGDRPLCCTACGHRISDDAYRIEVNGAHEHTFVNPGAVVYTLGCFVAAPGCAHVGVPETAFTWFPGFAWQVAVCARCRAHLGWSYRGAGDPFYGLVLAALRRA